MSLWRSAPSLRWFDPGGATLSTQRRANLYDAIGVSYSQHRRPDPRIAAQIHAALGPARTVCNVGAGTGAYEPEDRLVVAVEPSAVMIRQRSTRAVRAVAEALPFAAGAFEGAMAILTVHHWRDVATGLRELRRVAPRRVVLAFDVAIGSTFWLAQEYLPGLVDVDVGAPSSDLIADALGASRVETVWVPNDCTDGFLAAYWQRPAAYLDPEVRACISTFARLRPSIVETALARLRGDLESGRWEARHTDLLDRDAMDYGYRLIVAE